MVSGAVWEVNKFFTHRTKEDKFRSNFKLTEIIRVVCYYITAPEMKLDNIQEIKGYSRQALFG